jgi:hypothetical protein
VEGRGSAFHSFFEKIREYTFLTLEVVQRKAIYVDKLALTLFSFLALSELNVDFRKP